MIKNIIFDFDGVLVDSEMLVGKAFCKYFMLRNIIFTEKDYSFYAGKKTVQVIDELSQKFKINEKKEFFDDIMNIAQDIYSKDLTPVEGAKNFLEDNNFNYLIGSNSVKKRILFGLKKVNFEKFIEDDKVFSFDMVENGKPYPDIYLKSIKTFNLDKDETVIIEDSAVGVEAGFNAGIKVFGLTAGGHWHSERQTKELIDAGAYRIVDSYKNILIEINKL